VLLDVLSDLRVDPHFKLLGLGRTVGLASVWFAFFGKAETPSSLWI
jgi:hypothetical protein